MSTYIICHGEQSNSCACVWYIKGETIFKLFKVHFSLSIIHLDMNGHSQLSNQFLYMNSQYDSLFLWCLGDKEFSLWLICSLRNTNKKKKKRAHVLYCDSFWKRMNSFKKFVVIFNCVGLSSFWKRHYCYQDIRKFDVDEKSLIRLEFEI